VFETAHKLISKAGKVRSTGSSLEDVLKDLKSLSGNDLAKGDLNR